MPNWVMNTMDVSGATAEIHRFLSEVKGKDSDFSFRRILPMPKSLNIVSGGSTKECIFAYALHPDTPQGVKGEALIHGAENPLAMYGIGPQSPTNGVPLASLLPVIKRYHETKGQVGRDVVYDSRTGPDNTFDSHAKYGKVYFENWKNHGSNDWYDWNNTKWGTKWDASEVVVDEPETSSLNPDISSVHIEFQTAWSMPEGIFAELIKKYPDLDFSGVYADEDIGSNCGTWSKNGREFGVVPMQMGVRDAIGFACEVWGYDPAEYLDGYEDEGEE